MAQKLMILAAILVLNACQESAQTLPRGIGPDTQGRLPPVSQPAWPERIPGYTEADPETGLHMTGEPQRIRIEDFGLLVEGEVERPLALTYDELRRLPRVSSRPTLVCRGYFEDVATWAGASLSAILERARPKAGVKEVTLISADGYESSVSLDVAMSPDAYLAYELEGRVLPVLHGFPLRAVFPTQTGSKWVKWLVAIRIGSAPQSRGLDGAKEK